MITIAFAALALLLDASPKPEPVSRVVSSGVAVQETQPAPLLSVAVTLECTARTSGQVENCQVLGETHPGLGFGEAAIALIRDATVEPSPQDFQFARTIQFVP